MFTWLRIFFVSFCYTCIIPWVKIEVFLSVLVRRNLRSVIVPSLSVSKLEVCLLDFGCIINSLFQFLLFAGFWRIHESGVGWGWRSEHQEEHPETTWSVYNRPTLWSQLSLLHVLILFAYGSMTPVNTFFRKDFTQRRQHYSDDECVSNTISLLFSFLFIM